MIIISDLRGQLCNRIFMSAYGLSLQQLTGQKFLDFSLDKYAALFPATQRTWLGDLGYKFARLIVRLVAKAAWLFPRGLFLIIDVNWENSADMSPGNPEFIARLKRRPLTFIRIISYFNIGELRFPNTEMIRQTFDPGLEIRQAARGCALRAKGDADVLVGLHIRRGDYDIHLGGRLYYPFKVYCEAMEGVLKLFPGKTVAFLVCSNVELPADLFTMPRTTRGPGKVLEDLYSMAECDYIVATPSSFSLWAAYYGRKPIHQMLHPQPPQSLDEFMVPDGHFECYDLNMIENARPLF